MTDNTGYRQFLTIDGHRLGYVVCGDPASPPLLMVHGWLSHARFWRQTMAAFEQSHYCVAVDLLGHGYSDKPRDGDYSISAHAGRVLKVADALGLTKFAYIGHSMGGQIGLSLTLNAPERVTRLISVDGVVTGRLTAYMRYVETPILWLGSIFPPIWNVSRVLMRYRWYSNIFDKALFYQPILLPFDGEDRQMAMARGNETLAYRGLQAIAALDLTDSLPKIKTPTLAIFGNYDNCVPVSDGRLIEQKVPGSKLALIEECGHTPMLEQPGQYLDMVREFLVG
jgi:2-hydroxy-6-oxonona-2,4-dienedioate hydrolase